MGFGRWNKGENYNRSCIYFSILRIFNIPIILHLKYCNICVLTELCHAVYWDFLPWAWKTCQTLRAHNISVSCCTQWHRAAIMYMPLFILYRTHLTQHAPARMSLSAALTLLPILSVLPPRTSVHWGTCEDEYRHQWMLQQTEMIGFMLSRHWDLEKEMIISDFIYFFACFPYY